MPGLHRAGTLAHHMTDDGFVCLDDPEGAVAVPARAGEHRGVLVADAALHRPEPTDGVRKAYILQYAVDPSVILREGEDGNVDHEAVDHPERRFPLLQGGRRVTAG